MRLVLLIILGYLFCCPASAQHDSLAKSDSSRAVKKRIYSGPRKASILSAILPGAGQVFNRKYWKVPIIYAGLGGLGYMFYVNNSEYNYYRGNLAAIHDLNESTNNETPYSSEQLVTLKHEYRRFRDFAILGGVLVYLLNIIDANVDAHLKTFDVSDDLSLHLSPYTNMRGAEGPGFSAGASLKLKFR